MVEAKMIAGGGLRCRLRAMNRVVLVVDDDEAIRTQMKWALSREFEIALAENRPLVLETFTKRKPVVTLLDLGLPPRPNDPGEGLSALSEILPVVSPAGAVRRPALQFSVSMHFISSGIEQRLSGLGLVRRSRDPVLGRVNAL